LHLLRGTPFDLFKLRMDTWGQPLAAGGDALLFPALAVDGARIRAIAAPVLCGFDAAIAAAGGRDRDDALATAESTAALAACFPGLHGDGAVLAADDAAWTEAVVAFVAQLPSPLPSVPLRYAAVAAAATVAATTRTWARSVLAGAGGADDRANSVSSVDQREANISAAVDGAAGTRTCRPSSLGDMLGLTVGSAGEDAIITLPADPVAAAAEAAKRNCTMWGAPAE
jgi:hypothetical protein